MNITKNEAGEVRTSDEMPPIFTVNETVVNPENAAGTFNRLSFFTATDSLNLQSNKKTAATSFLRDSYPNSFPNMTTIPITEAKINNWYN
jgi:hypothetical protein